MLVEEGLNLVDASLCKFMQPASPPPVTVSGLSDTVVTGIEFRVFSDQRSGWRSLASS